MNPFTNLLNYCNSSEKDVYHIAARRIAGDMTCVLRDTIYETAECCASSVATVSRLAKRLGFRDYTDMRHKLTDSFRHYPYQNRLIRNESAFPAEEVCDKFAGSFASLQKRIFSQVSYQELSDAASRIEEASSVRFYTYNYSFAEISFQENLLKRFKASLLFSSVRQQQEDAETLEPGDLVVLVYPDSPMAMDLIPLAKQISERGASSLLITSSPTSSYRAYADASLAFPGDGTNMDFWGLELIVAMLSVIYRRKYIDS